MGAGGGFDLQILSLSSGRIQRRKQPVGHLEAWAWRVGADREMDFGAVLH